MNEHPHNKPISKSIKVILRGLLILIALIPLILAIYTQWEEVKTGFQTIQLVPLAIAIIILLLIQPSMGLLSWLVLRSLGVFRRKTIITAIYFLSQVPKYLPGGIWAFPGRVIAYQAIGVGRIESVNSVTREVAILYTGAALLSASGIFIGIGLTGWLAGIVSAGLLGCIFLAVLLQTPKFWGLVKLIPGLSSWGPRSFLKSDTPLSITWISGALAVSLLYWLVNGVAIWYLVRSVSPSASGIYWYHGMAIFSLAWCAGFVVIFAPAGLGIREATLAALLQSYLPAGEALTVALLARLCWTLGEGIFILGSLIWLARSPKEFYITKSTSTP